MHPNTKRQQGFTLIEMLVYMAVLVLVSGALITTFLSFDTVLLRNKTERELTGEARASLEYMVHSIRQAESVHMPLSTFDVSPGALALTEGATTTEFYVADGKVMVEINDVSVGPLTSSAATVEALTFYHYESGTTDLVRIALTVSSQNNVTSTTRTFYASGVIRGLYE